MCNIPPPPIIPDLPENDPFFSHKYFTSLEQLAIYGTNRELAYWVMSNISTFDQFEFVHKHFFKEIPQECNPMQFRMFLYLISQVVPVVPAV